MNAILLGDFEPNSPEWHALRERGIGASEIAAVVGLSPFESTFALWHRKKGNLPGPDPANPLFYWGHALEPLVAKRFAELHREEFPHVIEVGTYGHTERTWQIANLDRELWPLRKSEQRSILEIKTTRYADNWGPHGSTDIPLHVRCQVMQQMDVMGYPFAYVAVLIGGNDYREYRIEFDESDAAALRSAGAEFWASVQGNEEPPVDASWATYEAVRVLHPDIDEDLDVEIDPALWIEYAQTKHVADQHAADHREAKSALLHAMGNARRGLIDGSPIVRRQAARGGSVALYPIKSKDAA